jgi:uncharacterized protein YbjQ (UPF0145 family)
MNRRMVVTTTSTLEGWEIKEYLGPITAQVVLGTGPFSEVFASFTDLFGARSGSYESKLDKIQHDVIEQLKRRAAALHADAIVGLRVDTDEVAAGTKGMLMVAASGTAVRAKRTLEGSSVVQRATSITRAELELSLRRTSLLDDAREGRLKLDDETWELLITGPIPEVAALVFTQIEDLHDGPSDPTVKQRAAVHLLEYLASIPRERAIEVLYEAMARPDAPNTFVHNTFPERMIVRGEFFDVTSILSLLLSGLDKSRTAALRSAMAEKPSYSHSDIESTRALAAEIEGAFQEIPLVELKGIMGTRMTWLCSCGTTQVEGERRCHACARDRLGIPLDTPTPSSVADSLRRRADAIEEMLK